MVNKNVEKRKHQEIFINLNKSMYVYRFETTETTNLRRFFRRGKFLFSAPSAALPCVLAASDLKFRWGGTRPKTYQFTGSNGYT